MTTEWDDRPDITREMWREHARELERLLAAERDADRSIRLASLAHLTDENTRLRQALAGVCYQFGAEVEEDGRRYLTTLALRDLQYAFDVLGWDDPHPVEEPTA